MSRAKKREREELYFDPHMLANSNSHHRPSSCRFFSPSFALPCAAFFTQMGRFMRRIALQTLVFAGDLIVQVNSQSVVNPVAEPWLGLNVQSPEFQQDITTFTADSSDAGIFISPIEAAAFRAPAKLDNSTIPLSLVANFIERWNNTQDYWNRGYRSRSQVPSTLSNNFIAYGE